MIETATFDAKTNYVELMPPRNVEVIQHRSPTNTRAILEGKTSTSSFKSTNSSLRSRPKSRRLRMDAELDMRICSAPISRDSSVLPIPENSGKSTSKSFYIFKAGKFPRNFCIRLLKNSYPFPLNSII